MLWVGMFRSVDAVTWLMQFVAGRSPRSARVASRASKCETSDLYSSKLYVIRTVRVLTIILSPNTCSL